MNNERKNDVDAILKAHEQVLLLHEDFMHCLFAFFHEDNGFNNMQKQKIAARAIHLVYGEFHKSIMDIKVNNAKL